MTPTEQDNELQAYIAELFGMDKHEDWYDSYRYNERVELFDYITADRKRVELEARLDERQMLNFHRAYGRDYQATLETLEEANDERIAELKAQQEEL